MASDASGTRTNAARHATTSAAGRVFLSAFSYPSDRGQRRGRLTPIYGAEPLALCSGLRAPELLRHEGGDMRPETQHHRCLNATSTSCSEPSTHRTISAMPVRDRALTLTPAVAFAGASSLGQTLLTAARMISTPPSRSRTGRAAMIVGGRWTRRGDRHRQRTPKRALRERASREP